MAPTVLLAGVEDAVGCALASGLAASECRIVLAASSFPSTLVNTDDAVKFVQLDLLSDEKIIETAVKQAWDAHGKLDALVFCSNYQGTLTPALEIDEKEWDAIVGKNLKAAWLISKAVARVMKAAGTGGSIVFVTSIASTSRGLFPGISVYGTSMAGIHHLSKSLALELGKYNIRVNSIVRGFCEQDVVLKSLPPERTVGDVAKLLPLRRWANATHDFTSVLRYFISDNSSFLTGTTIPVDGGQSIVRPRLRARF